MTVLIPYKTNTKVPNLLSTFLIHEDFPISESEWSFVGTPPRTARSAMAMGLLTGPSFSPEKRKSPAALSLPTKKPRVQDAVAPEHREEESRPNWSFEGFRARIMQ